MPKCPKCAKELSGDAKFCDGCGTPVIREKACPSCGKATADGVAFCNSCGAKLNATPAESVAPVDVPADNGKKEERAEETKTLKEEKDSKESSKQKKGNKGRSKLSRKKLLIIAIAAALLLAIGITVLIICLTSGPAPEKKMALYYKDGEIYVADPSTGKKTAVTSNLFEDVDLSYDKMILDVTAVACRMSSDGRVFCYPDKMSQPADLTLGYSLYCRFLDEPDKDPIKIASSVGFYNLSKDGSVITYRKATDNSLYQYNINEENNEKIGTNIEGSFKVSDSGDTVYYVNSDKGLYCVKNGEGEKIDSSITSIAHVSEDFKTIYYEKDGSLYKKADGKDREKIASDVENILAIYESGEVYFTKSNPQELQLKDCLTDVNADSDANMQRPTEPSYNDYESTDAYHAAMEEYNAAYGNYQKKLKRDNLRASIEDIVITVNSCKLCYYDGENVSIVVNDFSHLNTKAEDSAFLAFHNFAINSFEKTDLADCVSVDYAIYKTTASLEESCRLFITAKDNYSAIDSTKVNLCFVSDDGTEFYFLDTSDADDVTGDLYRVEMKDGEPEKPKLFDSDVCTVGISMCENGKMMYYKDVKVNKNIGDFYMDKSKVDYDVYIGSPTYAKTIDSVVYFTDYDEMDEKGTLRIYDGKESSKISDDVHSFRVSRGDAILYTYDYSTTYFRGDLYIFESGEKRKLDMDVTYIFYIY